MFQNRKWTIVNQLQICASAMDVSATLATKVHVACSFNVF